MEIKCSYSKLVDSTELVENPKNPNKHPQKQIELLAKIMTFQGVRSPVVVSNRSGFITKGHGRLQAIKLNKWDKVPVDYQDYESEAQEYADMIADNKIAELAEHDDAMMVSELGQMEPFDYDYLGIPDFELPGATKEDSADEDSVPDEPVEAKSKLGQIYKLGKHRLMCGDATKDVDELLDGVKPSIGFCDPPYNLGFKYESYKDDKSYEEYLSFCGAWFSELKRNSESQIITPGTKNIHMWCNIDEPTHVGCWVKKNWITSCKVSNLQQWEPILFFGDFDRNSRSSDLFEINRTHQKDVGDKHTCPKQMEFMTEVLSWAGDTVLDLFGGSGSTLIACEKTNRSCYMMEIEPKYIDVIIERWEKYTGQEAELIRDV